MIVPVESAPHPITPDTVIRDLSALGISAGNDEFMGAGDRPAGRHDVELHLDPIASQSGGNSPQGITPFQSVRYFRHLATTFPIIRP